MSMLLNTISKVYMRGEWCRYLGKENYHEFQRTDGHKYYLDNNQFSKLLTDLIDET
jgi:hypothetical protein